MHMIFRKLANFIYYRFYNHIFIYQIKKMIIIIIFLLVRLKFFRKGKENKNERR